MTELAINVLVLAGNAVLFFAWLAAMYRLHVLGECPCQKRRKS